MTELCISPDLTLPLEAVTEAFAILAVSGAGKSNAGVVLAEELYDNDLPWVAIDPKGDWWGVRSSADGKTAGLSVVVFGGEHADVPLEPGAGRYIADLIVERRLTCVLDISEMTKADQRRFLIDFAERLYKRNREPLMVICEEADEYIPQMVRGDMAKLVGAMETLVKRGRFRGIGTCLITQRSASLNKDVLSQARNLIVLQTTSPQDRKAILDWIRHHAASQGVVDELPQLQPGEAYLFSPAWLRTLVKMHFRRRRTFDSGATPKIGEKRRAPARLADVDLAAIKEAMADTIERAKADDPKELHKRIAELERQLQARPAAEPERVEIPVFGDQDRGVLQDVVEGLDSISREIAPWRTIVEQLLQDHATQLQRSSAPEKSTTRIPVTGQPSGRPQPTQPAPRALTGVALARLAAPTASPGSQHRPAGDGSTTPLKKGAARMLTVLAQFHPRRLTRDQLSTLAEVTRGGTFSSYLSSLNMAGYIDVSDRDIALTQAGIDAAGDAVGQHPMTTEQLVAAYSRKLKSGARRMLDLLVAAYPDGYTRNDLSDAAEVTRGGTFSSYLSSLVTNGLAEATRDDVKASPTLFMTESA